MLAKGASLAWTSFRRVILNWKDSSHECSSCSSSAEFRLICLCEWHLLTTTLCEQQLLTAWCCYLQWKPVTVSVNCSCWQLGAVTCTVQWKPVTVSVNCSCWQPGAVTCSGNQWLSLWTAVVDSLVLLQAVETREYLCELQLLTAWCCYRQWKPVTVFELQLLTAWCCYMQWRPVTISELQLLTA